MKLLHGREETGEDMPLAYAIIPARGGSKRIPRKNLKPFCGRPIIQRVVDVALGSGLFDKVVVSTDDEEIAAMAAAAGAEAPFRRSAALSDDHTGTTEVIRDAVERLNLEAHTPVCCIYATAVFVTQENLSRGYDALTSGDANWALAVVPFSSPIQRAYRRSGDRMVPFHPESMVKRSQDLEKAFFDAGQFYWALAETWRDPLARVWDGAAPVEIDPMRAMDIDTPEDWDHAEFLFERLSLTQA